MQIGADYLGRDIRFLKLDIYIIYKNLRNEWSGSKYQDNDLENVQNVATESNQNLQVL